VKTAYTNGIFSNSAELHAKASKTLAQHVNPKFFGYLASNNTMALTSCLISIGVRRKHVLLSNFTFPATLDAIILAGGIPIVCDINPDTLVIETKDVENLLNNSKYEIAAVLPTRVFGFVTDLSDLISTCNASGVEVVVDAAASLPSRSGLWDFDKNAKFEIFSLHATKVFGIGEGGLVIGDSESIEKVRQASNFGFVNDGTFQFRDGLNAKADEFTAARVLARYEDYADDVLIRREFVQIYKEVFSKIPEIRMIEEGFDAIYSYFPIIFEREDQLLDFQKIIAPFIMSRRYYFPSIKSGYSGDAEIIFEGNLENSESITKRILCLPVYVSCTDEVKIEIKTLIMNALEKLK
jgi:dTDP-4-amino-4,6-dideoxygalactose transaminase